MLPLIIAGLTKVGFYAAAVEGASVVVAGAKRLAPEKYAPMVAGIGDSFLGVLDPLDLTGYRSGKEKDAAQKLAAAQGDAKAQKALAKKNAKAKKVAEKKIAQLNAKLKKAQKEEAAAEKKAAQLAAQGKKVEAQRAKEKADASRRYQQIANRARAESNKAKDEGNNEDSAKFAAQALEIAKLAVTPPKSAIESIMSETTDAGKALITSLIDSVNTERDFNADVVFESMQQQAPQGYGVDESWLDGELDGYVEGIDYDAAEETPHVAGSCCSSCATGSGGCGGHKSVPDALVSGAFEDYMEDGADNFLSFLDGEDLEVSGPDDFTTFFQGEQAWDTEAERRHGSCVDGRCFGPPAE